MLTFAVLSFGKNNIIFYMRAENRRCFLYIAFCLALVPVLLLRDFTPANELRYLSIADEALRNHTFFTFYNHGVPYADKPPLYLWILMLLRWLLGGHHMWAIGLVSVIPALVTVGVMDGWAGKALQGKGRFSAELMLLTSAFFLGAAVTVRMDMLMCMFIVLALRSFWSIYTRSGNYRRARWMFALYVFLALFTKGPLGVLVPLCATVVFLVVRRQPWRILDVWGWRTWTVLLAGCVLWFGAVYAEGGNAYLDNLLFHQTVDRAVNAFHHKRPFHYYLVCMWYCVAPWSVLAVLSVVVALCRGVRRCGDLQMFFAVTSASTIVLLSCISSKLQIYMLPAIPFMAYSAALFWSQSSGKWYAKAALGVPAAMLCVALVSVECAVNIAPAAKVIGTLPVYAASAVLSVSGFVALWRLFGKRPDGAVCGIGAGLLVAVFVGSFALLRLNGKLGYGELCKTVAEVSRRTGINNIAAYHVKNAEDMDVYLGRSVKEVGNAGTLPGCLDNSCLLIMPTAQKDSLEGFGHYSRVAVGEYTIVLGSQPIGSVFAPEPKRTK